MWKAAEAFGAVSDTSISASKVSRMLPFSTCHPEGVSTETIAGVFTYLDFLISFKSLTIVAKGSLMESPVNEKPKMASIMISYSAVLIYSEICDHFYSSNPSMTSIPQA